MANFVVPGQLFLLILVSLVLGTILTVAVLVWIYKVLELSQKPTRKEPERKAEHAGDRSPPNTGSWDLYRDSSLQENQPTDSKWDLGPPGGNQPPGQV